MNQDVIEEIKSTKEIEKLEMPSVNFEVTREDDLRLEEEEQWWAFCSEKGRGQIVRGLESEFQTHEVGIVPNFWLFRPSEI